MPVTPRNLAIGLSALFNVVARLIVTSVRETVIVLPIAPFSQSGSDGLYKSAASVFVPIGAMLVDNCFRNVFDVAHGHLCHHRCLH
jgi:hypothetical protein